MIKIYAVGRITNEPKVFSYGDNKKGVSFSIASNDRARDKVEYLNCVMFNRDENFAKYLEVGDQVIVTGNFSKNKENYVSCIVDDLEFGAKKQK